MTIEELEREIASRPPIRHTGSHFSHVQERFRERCGAELTPLQYQEITESIRRGETLSYGVFFEKDRRFDDWHRAFVGEKELLVMFDRQKDKPVTVLPVEAKSRMQKAFRKEYGDKVPIRF